MRGGRCPRAPWPLKHPQVLRQTIHNMSSTITSTSDIPPCFPPHRRTPPTHPCVPTPAHPASMQRILRTLLLASLVLAAAASPISNRKLLLVGCDHGNVCTQNHVYNGCLFTNNVEVLCTTGNSGKTKVTKCPAGTVCDVAALKCVPEEPAGPCDNRPDGCYHFSHHDGMCVNGQQSLCPNSGSCNADGSACEAPQPAGPCDNRPDGCYHFSHHDGMCLNGQQSLCPNSGSCNADGTACEGQEDPNAKCEGKRNGCFTGHKGDYVCKDGKATTCPSGTRCSSASLDATCV